MTTIPLDPATIADLRSAIKGRIILPDDAEYDKARTVVSGLINRRPAAIVRVANQVDVSRVVSFARRTGVELAVRSGGHSPAGHGTTDGGIVLDLRDMRALDIDAEKRTAWAQAGLSAGEYSKAAGEYGLATGFGDTGSVGIGGITLGGGIGYLARKYGLTIDSLLAADIVTADGELLHVDEESHPDLFWAIRGGGGNFGVATRFKYRLHEVGTIVGGMLMLPANADVIASFIAEADAAPEELTTIANVMPAPPMPFVPAEHHGKLVIMALMAYAGDVEAGQRAMAPFRALATPVIDMVRPIPYPQIYPPDEEDYHPMAVNHSLFMDKVDRSTAETIIDYLQSSKAQMAVAQVRVLGGAVARVPAEATAYAHRSAPIMTNVAAMFGHPDEMAQHEDWISRFTSALHQGEDGIYVNFLGEVGEEEVHKAYPGATWSRLAEVKAQYDPTNLFRLNQNIPPSTKN